MRLSFIFIVPLLLWGWLSEAQPVVTAAAFTDFSETSYDVPLITGLTAGGAGANQVWNFGSVVIDPTTSYNMNTVQASSAPYFSTFPTANYCIRYSVTFEGMLFENFMLQHLSNTGLEGLAVTASDMIQENYTPNTHFMPLPLHFGDTYVDTYQSTTDPAPLTSTNTYDAYGTLTTPYGTFTNVVRVKYVSASETSYEWFQLSPYRLLLSGDFSPAGYVTVYDPAALSVNQPVAGASKISVTPNPATTHLNLNMPENMTIDSIRIVDLSGKTVAVPVVSSSPIDISKLAAGIYILRVTSKGSKMDCKFVKQ